MSINSERTAIRFAILPKIRTENPQKGIMIRVLLADDQGIVHLIFRQVLEKADNIQIVSLASNGQEAVNEAIAHSHDVVVMDVSMPIMDGVEATKQIRAKCLDTRY